MDEKEKEQQRIERLLTDFSFENAVIKKLKGYFYRTVNYRYSRQPLSTRGAELTGGRYNFRPHNGTSFSCLYCAEKDITASTEKFYNLKTQNAPLPPHTIVCISVRLQQILDLSTPENCEQARVNWQELNQSWEYHQDILGIAAYPQRIGNLAYITENIEGIVFTSTKMANTVNLALFPERIAMPSFLEIYDPQSELGYGK
ncbi:MAG: RES family NAD+ phosphorylase [Waterburya sp.]